MYIFLVSNNQKKLDSLFFVLIAFLMTISQTFADQPDEKDVIAAMKKSADFMMNTVSNRGGFLWDYKADFSEQWGEVPMRKTMIMVQGIVY